jgi:hypothetical protein
MAEDKKVVEAAKPAKTDAPVEKEAKLVTVRSVKYPIRDPYTKYVIGTSATEVLMSNWLKCQLDAKIVVACEPDLPSTDGKEKQADKA